MGEIKEIKNKVNKDVVSTLEMLLGLAKKGRIQLFSSSAVMSDGDVGYGFCGDGNVYTLLGAMEALKKDFIDANIESLEDQDGL